MKTQQAIKSLKEKGYKIEEPKFPITIETTWGSVQITKFGHIDIFDECNDEFCSIFYHQLEELGQIIKKAKENYQKKKV